MNLRIAGYLGVAVVSHFAMPGSIARADALLGMPGAAEAEADGENRHSFVIVYGYVPPTLLQKFSRRSSRSEALLRLIENCQVRPDRTGPIVQVAVAPEPPPPEKRTVGFEE